MSIFRNYTGKIVVSNTNKPIECLTCPCETRGNSDPFQYCIKKEFYSGNGCTGNILQTLRHQCMCMDPYCSDAWDKVAFCDGQVKYTYEGGPFAGSCENNCQVIQQCLAVMLTNAGVYQQGNYDPAGSIFYRYGQSYYDALGNGTQIHAAVTNGEPYRWQYIQDTYGATISPLSGWFLTIGQNWNRIDNNDGMPPLILRPNDPDDVSPALGAWSVAWAPDGFDYSSLTCTMGGNSKCSVCGTTNGTSKPSYPCMNNVDFSSCKCAYNVTVSGVVGRDEWCTQNLNGNQGTFSKNGVGAWVKPLGPYAYASNIFCSNSPSDTGLSDGNYYWCLYLEFYPNPYYIGRLRCRLTSGNNCDFTGTYVPFTASLDYCPGYTSLGTVTISPV